MGEFVLGVLALVALTVIVPVALIGHFIIRWRAVRALSGEEERTVTELWQTAEKLRGRIANLERVLDEQAPGWRNDR